MPLLKTSTRFFPTAFMAKNAAGADVMIFPLNLNKDSLPRGILLQKEQKEEQKRFLEQLYAEDPFVDVLPNAAFTVNVKKLEINRRNQQPLQEVKGKLMNLDSGVVRLSTECYMIFKVLKTSENGSPVNYFEYKLFGVKNGQAELYIKENTYTVYDGRVSLTAKGIPERNDGDDDEYDEDIAGYEVVKDTAETAPVSNAYLDFEIDITFGAP
jgi:hypothetical protein